MADTASQSPFARLDTNLMRSTKTPPVPEQQQGDQSQKRQSVRSNGRTGERQTGRRIITRNSFEIYEDQMDSLRALASKELETTGKMGSMSAMVREAIDNFIFKRSS